MWYNLDYKKLVVQLLLIFWRKKRLIAFVQVAVTPIIRLHEQFKRARLDDHYQIDHNWQKCYLQKALNDRFDVSERRIRIVEGKLYDRKYIYTHGEKKPKYLGRIYLRVSSDFADKGYDFTVDMNRVSADVYDIEALVRFYKLEGTRFNIINMPNSLSLITQLKKDE
ncbi:hypothetical protein QP519_11000 [Weeksella virosa]|uniref:hypothetical protein n=1 Tax=Weeksella virosa TaxID=1014 RepID=UPI002553BCAA|nr:hypothetical protein [Weeksella virosa]MDK7376059.1 hypothetical protein [Weeksella virosa]MDK7674401.1 hypothetical protein [Weeksella virosa]